MEGKKKDCSITFRTTTDVKDKLNKIAYKEDRPISYIVERELKKIIYK